jgi:hypothetical protein
VHALARRKPAAAGRTPHDDYLGDRLLAGSILRKALGEDPVGPL